MWLVEDMPLAVRQIVASAQRNFSVVWGGCLAVDERGHIKEGGLDVEGPVHGHLPRRT
jgi:hypothetical protein